MKRTAEPINSHRIARILLGALAVACVPALALVDGFIAIQRGWRPENSLQRAVLAFSILVLIVILLGFLLSPCRRWFSRRAPQLWLTLGSVMFALAVCEEAVRLWFPATPLHTRPSGYRQSFTPDATELKGLSLKSNYRINSLGLRGPEPSATFLGVLCIGGTTTECVFLDDSKTWPSQLMASLNEAKSNQAIWVANAGQGSLATGHHLRFLEESPLTSQFDYVIFLTGLNDLLRSLRGLDSGDVSPPLFDRLAVLELAQRVWNGHLGMGLISDSSGTKLTLFRRLQPHTKDYVIPDLTAATAAYRRRLNELIDECRRRKITPVFLTQPVTGSVKLRRRLDLAEARNVDLLAEMIDLYNAALIDVCASRNVEVVDLSSMTGVDRYFCDHYNFSEAGAAEVARLVAEQLRAQIPVK